MPNFPLGLVGEALAFRKLRWRGTQGGVRSIL